MALLEEYFTEQQLAAELGITTRTTRRYRNDRIGPPVTYITGKPHYRKESARQWLLAREGAPYMRSKQAV